YNRCPMARGLELSPAVQDGIAAAAIALRNVSMTFGGAQAIQALQDITLAIQPGELVSLIGPSGCGKSTLLRLIGDLLAPTSGSISVNAKSPRQARMSR